MEKPYEFVTIDQNTPSWEAFRKTVLGSSDAPVVMGVSPWRTPYQLWEEKTGRKAYKANSFITQKGHEAEPKARATYQLLHDVDMPPAVVRSTQYKFLGASLDGFNPEISRVLEIKFTGRLDHKEAKEGRVPLKYKWQLEHQLLVTGADHVHYFSYHQEKAHDTVDTALVVYRSDEIMRHELIQKHMAFWDFVKKDIPPPLCDRDVLEIDSEDMKALAEEIKVVKKRLAATSEILDQQKKEFEELKARFVKNAEHPRIRCNGVEATRVDGRNKEFYQVRVKDDKSL